MSEIRLTIIGQPVAKARARTMRSKAGASYTYTPQPTVAAEEAVKVAFLTSGQEPIAPPGTPLALQAVFYLDRPPSAPKRRRHPTVKPDYTNLVRLVEDALAGLAFHDDAEIVTAYIKKRYVSYPDPARTEIRIRTL